MAPVALTMLRLFMLEKVFSDFSTFVIPGTNIGNIYIAYRDAGGLQAPEGLVGGKDMKG